MCDIQQTSVSSKVSVLEINHRMIHKVLLELEATGSMQEVPDVLPVVLSNDALFSRNDLSSLNKSPVLCAHS